MNNNYFFNIWGFTPQDGWTGLKAQMKEAGVDTEVCLEFGKGYYNCNESPSSLVTITKSWFTQDTEYMSWYLHVEIAEPLAEDVALGKVYTNTGQAVELEPWIDVSETEYKVFSHDFNESSVGETYQIGINQNGTEVEKSAPLTPELGLYVKAFSSQEQCYGYVTYWLVFSKELPDGVGIGQILHPLTHEPVEANNFEKGPGYEPTNVEYMSNYNSGDELTINNKYNIVLTYTESGETYQVLTDVKFQGSAF